MKNINEIARWSKDYIDAESYRIDTYKTLLDSLQYVYGMDVAGDIAEFGTMTARTAVSLSVGVRALNRKYANDARGGRKLHFFDSFVGLPEAEHVIDVENPHVIAGIWAAGTCCGLSA